MKFTIYKIVSINIDLDKCYIGSTRNLKSRSKLHYSDCNNINSPRYNYPIYQYIRNNGGMENFEFINLRDTNIDGDDMKAIHEQHFFELYGGFTNFLNKYYPNRSTKEYRTDNKEAIKQYRNDHKEKMKAYQKIYRNKNKINI